MKKKDKKLQSEETAKEPAEETATVPAEGEKTPEETFDLEAELGTEKKKPVEKHLKLKRAVALTICALIITTFVLIFIYVGIPMFKYAKEPDKFQAWIEEFGPWGKLVLFGMQVAQIVVALIPGGPLEVVAGVAFGQWWALLICVLGAFVGDLIGFFLARILGSWIVHLFFSDKQLKVTPRRICTPSESGTALPSPSMAS